MHSTFTIYLVAAKVTFVSVFSVNFANHLALALFFAMTETSFVNSFILVLSINSISIEQVILPLAFVNVTVIKYCEARPIFSFKLIESALIT
jgi:hypothetical protein